jgi:tetratricopeptide (TPR) repeat protein
MLKKKKDANATSATTATMDLTNPQSVEEFVQRGWNHYSKKEYFRAETDFNRALELSPHNPDILYALGLNLQASGRPQEAIAAFQKVNEILQAAPEDEIVRAHMLMRLSRGHINKIKTGDWHIEG